MITFANTSEVLTAVTGFSYHFAIHLWHSCSTTICCVSVAQAILPSFKPHTGHGASSLTLATCLAVGGVINQTTLSHASLSQ